MRAFVGFEGLELKRFQFNSVLIKHSVSTALHKLSKVSRLFVRKKDEIMQSSRLEFIVIKLLELIKNTEK